MLFQKKCELKLFINLVSSNTLVFLAFHDFKVVDKFQMMFADEFLTGRIALKEPFTSFILMF